MAEALFKKIQLETTKLGVMRKFYGDSLGFPLNADEESWFAVQIGSSVLEFQVSANSTGPLYHFAFNVPENKIEEALKWAQERIEIVANPSTGHPIFEFDHWNAHAFYFLDPEGNIGEFIARHTIENASSRPFDVDQIECVSEIGLATSDVPLVAQALADKLGLLPYPDPNAKPNGEFQAVGSDSGMFIIAKKGRVWLSSDKRAGAFPVSVAVNLGRADLPIGGSSAVSDGFALADTRCRIEIA